MGTCSVVDRSNGLVWVSTYDFKFRQIIGKGGFGKASSFCEASRGRCGRSSGKRTGSSSP